ncbi:MAG TPA: DUF4907 domain-containing protein [Cyclobacteriaceae bacterium]|nr:DUF4907 domain-containing protein [Cyclobacteriaceae bacterium]
MSRICSLVLIFCLLFYGCDKDPICGCKGIATKTISDEIAIITDSEIGFVLISGTYGIFELCDSPGELLRNSLIVKFEGNIRSNCLSTYSYGPYQEVKYRHINLATFEILPGNEDIYQSGEVEIRLIKSEDYGYSSGFGYEINSGFIKITQPFIPGGQGYRPFTTADDALKVALLVSAKIQEFKDLPSLTEEELRFINIL